MALILERRLSGWNDVYKAVDNVQDFPGVESFSDFLKKIDFSIPQLSEFLKIPVSNLRRLKKEGGYLSGDAARNIYDYLNIRHNPSERAFYEGCQHGKLEREPIPA